MTSISLAVLSDLDQIMNIEHNCFDIGLIESSKVIKSRLENFQKGFLIVKVGHKIVGYLSSELWVADRKITAKNIDDFEHNDRGSILYISSTSILPEFRGKGYCKLLIQNVLATVKHEQSILIVAENNNAAKHIYENFGYKKLFQIKNYYYKNTAIVLQKD